MVHPKESKYIFDRNIHDNGVKREGVTRFPLQIIFEKYDPINFPILWFLLIVN